jgi:hemerythrin-like domain-containing protein
VKATDVLRAEHRIIQTVLKCLAAATEEVAGGGSLDMGSSGQMLVFFREFVDACHHRKEEGYLFPAAQERGVTCKPGHVSILLAEHEEGRGYVRSMDASLSAIEKHNGQATAQFCEHAKQYARLLALHIHKEDDCLFPKADEAFSPADQQSLLQGFEEVETQELKPGTHEKLHRMAHELCERWEIPIPSEAEQHNHHGHV